MMQMIVEVFWTVAGDTNNYGLIGKENGRQ